MVDNACLKSARCLTGIVSEPTVFERINQLLRYTLISSRVMWCVWSSFANLSISRHTGCFAILGRYVDTGANLGKQEVGDEFFVSRPVSLDWGYFSAYSVVHFS